MDLPKPPASATIAFASTPERAAELLSLPASMDEAGPRPVIVAPAPPLPGGVRVLIGRADRLMSLGAEVMFRRDGISSLAGLDRRWSDVRLPEGAERFERVRLPARLAASRAVAVTSLMARDAVARSPVGVLAGFAHPRQRIAAAAGRDDALLAELAAAVPVRWLLACGHFDGVGAAFSATDLPTAQLLWAALTRRDEAGTADLPVAWERNDVQRAVALCPGPARPQELAIRLEIEGSLSDRAEEFAARLLLALGPVAVETIPG